jgi:hypothetical protein
VRLQEEKDRIARCVPFQDRADPIKQAS